MARKVVEFVRDPRFVRRSREVRTVHEMIVHYCKGHGHARAHPGDLCPDCAALDGYARRRTERCIFGDAKPTCANCLVHCYGVQRREQIREVMRWAGPRMLLRHPILALAHKLDGLRPSPLLKGQRVPPAA